MKRKSVQQIAIGILCIPGGVLISWLALTGIQLGDSIYRFPYFIILGGVLAVAGVVNIISGIISFARKSNTAHGTAHQS